MSASPETMVVCFDLGGVLIRICRSWGHACRAAGLAIRSLAATPAVEAAHGALLHRYSVGELTEAEWAEQMAKVTRGEYSADEHLRIHDAVTLDEYAGVGEIVDALHAAGVRTACLSNTTETHWGQLMHERRRTPLPDRPRYPTVLRLQSHFASHLLHFAKPEPAIYRAFEAAMGCDASRILFFDDLPDNVTAARACGWRAERIDHTIETAPQLQRYLRAYGLL
jgi:FMN phosphatase YigB (HAD superfamily)